VNERNCPLVFQDFALFPHMTVFQNIAFGLKMQKFPKDRIKKEVEEVMKIVGLEGLGDRYPRELSGGQQQRVALARATVMKPSLILLDEPLGNLDYKLQQRMCIELKELQRKLHSTFIYVTHNQEQAMSLGDRIMILNQGTIEQIGTPQEIYFNPKTLFVAKFTGALNILSGELISSDGDIIEVKTSIGVFKGKLKERNVEKERKLFYCIRPEHIFIGLKAKSLPNTTEATLIGKINKGSELVYFTQVNGVEFQVITKHFSSVDLERQPGEKIILGWNYDDALIFPYEIK
jgi:ABC-type Fe3+/spermidine/putrescine transport system ATPase subunit